MLNFYIKNENKLFLQQNNEVHYYEFEDLEILLEEIVEEYQMQKENKEVVLTLDFEEFEMFVKEDKNKFVIKEIHNIAMIGLKKDKIKKYVRTFATSKFIIKEIRMDLISVYSALSNKEGNLDQEYMCIGMDKSYLTSFSQGEINEIKQIDIGKKTDMFDEYDFADIRVINETKSDIELIFLGGEGDKYYNFFQSKKTMNIQFTKKQVMRYLVIYLGVLFCYVLSVSTLLNTNEIKEQNAQLRESLKEQEQKYMKNRKSKAPKDYIAELEKLQSLDEKLKRREHYSFIKFLIDNNAYGIDYTSIIYEKGKWKIKGEFTKYDSFQKFEQKIEERYRKVEFMGIQEDDKKSSFEYFVEE